jgi:hypothetical protein
MGMSLPKFIFLISLASKVEKVVAELLVALVAEIII